MMSNRIIRMQARAVECPGWMIPEENEEIRGLGVSARLLCSLCGFLSTCVKLYKEIPSKRPGRRMINAMSTPSSSIRQLVLEIMRTQAIFAYIMSSMTFDV